MADKLTVKVKLDIAEAKKNLATLLKALGDADRVGEKMNKTLSKGGSNGIKQTTSAVTEAEKAVRRLSTNTKKLGAETVQSAIATQKAQEKAAAKAESVAIKSALAQEKAVKKLEATSIKSALAAQKAQEKASAKSATEAEKAVQKLEKSANKAALATQKAGMQTAKAFGSTLTNSLKSSISMMGQLAKSALFVASALSGISIGKAAMDYVEFSKGAGQLNAIVKGNPETARFLENTMYKATAGTGATPQQAMDSAKSLASTIQFDPTNGGDLKAGSKGYMANIAQMGSLTQRNAEFSSAMGTDLGIMTDSMIKYAGVFGYDLKNMDDVVKVQNKFNALLNTSQGGLERLIPQISKFGQEFKLMGVSEDESLSLFSTLTNVFDPEEAGTRTLAVAKWLGGNSGKLASMAEKMGGEVGEKFKDAVYNKDGSRKNMMKSIMGVMGIMESLDTDLQKDIFGGVTFSEIRQASGVKSTASLNGTYDRTLKEMQDEEGLSGKSIDAYWAASGPKIDLFFKSIEGGMQSSIGAMIDLFSNPSKFDFNGFSQGLEEIGAKLNYRLGEGASKPLRWMIQAIDKMKSPEGQAFLGKLGSAAEKLGAMAASLGTAVLDIVTSGPAQAIFDFVTSNPVMSISIAAIGLPLLQAGIGTAVSAAIGSAFAVPIAGLALTIGSLVVSQMLVTSSMVETQKILSDVETKNNQLKDNITENFYKNPTKSNLLKAAINTAEANKTSIDIKDQQYHSSGTGIVEGWRKQFSETLGIKDNSPSAKEKESLDRNINSLRSQLETVRRDGTANAPVSTVVGGIEANIKNTFDKINGQDIKIGEGADKLTTTAEMWSAMIPLMSAAAASVKAGGDHLASIQIQMPSLSGIIGSVFSPPTKSNSSNTSPMANAVTAGANFNRNLTA